MKGVNQVCFIPKFLKENAIKGRKLWRTVERDWEMDFWEIIIYHEERKVMKKNQKFLQSLEIDVDDCLENTTPIKIFNRLYTRINANKSFKS